MAERITAAQKKRINTAVGSLNKILEEVRQQNPNHRAIWYLDASETLSLLVEPKGLDEHSPDYSVHDVRLKAAQGGDW